MTVDRRRNVLIAFTIVVLAIVVVAVGYYVLDNHRGLTLQMVVSAEFDAPDVTTDVVETTNSTCVGALDCIEAYSTAEANYLRFSSRERAAEYAAALEDGFVVHYIVMDFAGKDDASREHQRWAMEGLAGTWQDYHGHIPQR